MISHTYPKIETLYNRDKETFKVDVSQIRKPEFSLVNRWIVTEKVDGTNIRVALRADGSVEFNGRTDNAQLPMPLIQYLTATFTEGRLQAAFEGAAVQADGIRFPEVILFGEGYGAGIQKGGCYRPNPSFRLFDVMVNGLWLEIENVMDIAGELNIHAVPVMAEINSLPGSLNELQHILPRSIVSLVESGIDNPHPEGIVARTSPLLFDRRGNRVMWKLKEKDF